MLISLGYSHEDVIKMTKVLPSLFGYSIETIKQKIDDLISLGYSYDDAIKINKKMRAYLVIVLKLLKKR